MILTLADLDRALNKAELEDEVMSLRAIQQTMANELNTKDKELAELRAKLQAMTNDRDYWRRAEVVDLTEQIEHLYVELDLAHRVVEGYKERGYPACTS